VDPKNVGLAALAVALFLALGAFGTTTPAAQAAISDFNCSGVTRVVADVGRTIACKFVTDHAGLVSIENHSLNVMTETTPGVDDSSPNPAKIGLNFGAGGGTASFEYECTKAFEDEISASEVAPGGEFESIHIICVSPGDVTLQVASTVTHGINAPITATGKDDVGGIVVATSRNGTLTVASTKIDEAAVNCPAIGSGGDFVTVDDQGNCDADFKVDNIVVTVAWTPDCPSAPKDVVIAGGQGFSKRDVGVKCLPPVSPTTTVSAITPPSTGDAGLMSPSESDASVLAIAAVVAAVLVGIAGLRFARRYV
jgi:hypothetical protein